MTYDGFETGIETSRPYEFYVFAVGADIFRYTSSEDAMTISGVEYEPEPIQRASLGQSAEDRDNVLEVTMPGNNEFVNKYKEIPPGPRASLTIQRLQRDDTPTPELITLFQGFVQSVAFTNNLQVATVAALPTASATSRLVPRFTYQALCNHVLYDSRCKVDGDSVSFRHDGTVTGVTGNDIDVQGADGFANGFFDGGYVEAQAGQDARMILSHTGTTLSLLLPFSVDPTGDSVVVRAGCDHSIATCKSKFNNVINYGGFPFVPTVNPFSSGLL